MAPRSFLLGLPLLAACALVACSDNWGEGEETSESGIAVSGRWVLPREVREAAEKVKLPYDDAPAWSSKNCGGRLLEGSTKLGEFLLDEFEAVTSVGGYACRANTANRKKMSVHGTGRALDVFIPKVGGAADNTRGDAVANWLVENAEQIGVQLVIWDRTVWMANGKSDKAYSGPHPHDDHIHVEITKDAAALKTAWFVDGPSADGGTSRRDSGAPIGEDTDAGDESDDHDMEVEDPGPEPTPTPTRQDAGTPRPEDPTADDDEDEINEEEGTRPSRPAPGEGYPEEADDDDDGPGEEDSLKTTSKKEKKKSSEVGIESSGCAVTKTAPGGPGAVIAPALLAVTRAAGLVRRRRRA